MVDVVIVTIREDEYEAVLDRVPNHQPFEGKHRTYAVGHIQNRHGPKYSVAIIRTPEQGPDAAQDTARDAIEDLDPSWIMVVGIGGAIPDRELTLGDVVVATRLHDFTVGALKEGKEPEFTNQGGAAKKEILDLAAFLPALKKELAGWETEASIRMRRPAVDLSEGNFYGNDEWRRKTKSVLAFHFAEPGHRTTPIVTTRAIAASGFLIKDTKIVESWKKSARDLMAVEMELPGVYAAARRRGKEYAVIAVRGISDIVGFDRDAEWTTYACHTAGSFSIALLKNMPAHFLHSVQMAGAEAPVGVLPPVFRSDSIIAESSPTAISISHVREMLEQPLFSLYLSSTYLPEIVRIIRAVLQEAETTKLIPVNLGLGQSWWSTRLHLLAALLADYTTVAQIVFTAQGDEYLGMCPPADVRRALSNYFPEVEIAYRSSLPKPAGPVFDPSREIETIVKNFVDAMDQRGGEANLKQWVPSYVLQNWGRFNADRIELPAQNSELLLREIVSRRSPFVALVADRKLEHLIDRVDLATQIAQSTLR